MPRYPAMSGNGLKVHSDLFGRRRRHPKQDHAARCGQSRAARDLAEVFVERQENSALACGPRDHILIGHSGRACAHPDNVVTGVSEAATAAPGMFSFARSRIVKRRERPAPRARRRVHN